MTDDKNLPAFRGAELLTPSPLEGELEKPPTGYLMGSYMSAVYSVLRDVEKYRADYIDGRTRLMESLTRFGRARATLLRVKDLIADDTRAEKIARERQLAELEAAQAEREEAEQARVRKRLQAEHDRQTARSDSRMALAKSRTERDVAAAAERQAAVYLLAVTEKFEALKAAKGTAAEAEALRDLLVLTKEIKALKADLGLEEEKAAPAGSRDFSEELLRRLASRRKRRSENHDTFLRVMDGLKHYLLERERPFPATLDGWVQVANEMYENNALSLEDAERFQTVASKDFSDGES